MTFSGNMKESKQRSAKNTWESELGYGWTQQRRCRAHRPPESTMSVSSDIRFTRSKLSRPCRGCCAALAALLVLLLLAAVALYFGHMYLFGDPLNRQTFRGSFVTSAREAREGAEGAEGAEPKGNHTREGAVRQALCDLYRNSELRSCFVSAEILALDSAEEGTRVHFEVSFEPIFTAVSTGEVAAVLARGLGAPAGRLAAALPHSLHIEESTVISSQALQETDATPAETPTTEAVAPEEEEVRECAPLTLPLCSSLPYNVTTFPNLVGHQTKDALVKDLVAFRELLDAECSHLAQDFVCQMLQPRCERARLVAPCRAYCRAFHAGCGARLPDRLRPHFDCARFPDFFGPGSCAPEPDCRGGLQRLALSRRSCDGTPDCADAGDERGCAHCAGAGGEALRCALHPRCLPPHLRCDGTPDCPDSSDEAGCLWVSRSLAWWRRETRESTLGAVRSRAGVAVWAERGRAGKVCAAPHERDARALASLGASLCKALTFKGVISAEAVPDTEADDADVEDLSAEARPPPEYVEVVDPFAPEISFVKSECPEKKVIRVVCDQLECGVQSARVGAAAAGVAGLARSARPGDWPWHAALLRAGVHACDAALLHPAWLVTTASCFQGQPKAEWTARLGTVRIQSTTPWQQERRVVGMVRSPVEGSMLALVRLEEPVEMTDFVRPACLPIDGTSVGDFAVCNTLSWTRNRDQLQRVHVVASPMHNCENVSIATVNGICAEPLYNQDDCDEEEYAGSSMMCFDKQSKHWSLLGVSGWRIACSKIGLGRPRIYDSVTSHVDWIRRTVANAAS